MAFTEKVGTSTSSFKLSEYPSELPNVSEQGSMNKWYFDLKTVLLRERQTLESLIGTGVTQADFDAYVAATDATLATLASEIAAIDPSSFDPGSLHAQINSLTAALAALTSTVATISSSLNAHIAATVAHGSNGNVVGINDLIGAMAFDLQDYTFSADATQTLSFLAGQDLCSYTVDLNDGTGAYTVQLTLGTADRKTGDVILMKLRLPASTNPTLSILSESSGGTLVSFTHDGIANWVDLRFVFDGTNWYVHAVNNLQTL